MRALLSCFFHHSEGNWFGKYLPYSSFKSRVCLLTHWLPITSILFRIVRIWRCLLTLAIILKTKKNFSISLFPWFNIHQILNIFKKNKIVIANVFSKWQTVKDLVGLLSKKRRFTTSFDSQHVKGSQTIVKSKWEHFCQIFSSL